MGSRDGPVSRGFAMEAIGYLQREWGVISDAPFSFVLGCLIFGGLAYAAARWRYQGRIETLKERIEQLKDAKSGPAKWG